jgi:stage II sporulation protein D
VAGESPPSWPAEALKAQAVAARTYAITSNAGGAQGFTQWSDTRSQVYRGVAGETPTTDAAVAATSRQIVTYLGKPVTTFFFSTSGGRTENVENSFLGATPQPWLKSVEDPYDNASPRHRWGPMRFTRKQAQARLRGYVKGTLRTIKVTRRGVSPRIVSAQVVGSKGTTTISGPTLRTRFGLFDTWATFTRIGTTVKPPAPAPPEPAAPPAPAPAPAPSAEPQPSVSPSGGIAFGAASHRAGRPTGERTTAGVLSGEVDRAKAGQWIRVLRRTQRGTWRTSFEVQAGAGGRFAATLPGPGTYKVRWNGIDGPTVRAR